MRIYVDFDDVLCETARALSGLARAMFGRQVPYRRIHAFDLRVAFDLDQRQHQALLDRAHEPGFLLGLQATPGAAAGLKTWLRAGHEVVVVTGRPSATHPSTSAWLARRGLAALPVLYVDKYGRNHVSPPGAPAALRPEDLRREHFDVAIDDSPAALDALLARRAARIIVFDRPWNRSYGPAHPGFRRCENWAALNRAVLEVAVRIARSRRCS